MLKLPFWEATKVFVFDLLSRYLESLKLVSIEKKWFKVPNLLYGFLTKCHGSLNNASRVNGDFCEKIFAHDFNHS